MRQRSLPWTHRWARPAIAALALFGFVLTSYLTVTHFMGDAPALCAAGKGEGCDLVLNSEYAKIFGIPLTIFGALAYLTIAGLAAVPWLFAGDNPKSKENVTQLTSFLLFLVSTSTFVFSGYLMYLIAFVIRTADGQAAFCLYCFSSAVTMTTIWLLNLFGNDWKDAGQLFFSGFIVAVVVLVATGGIYANQHKLVAQNQTFAGRLVQHLRATGVRMYGAYWCPHCREQKQMFGEAAKQIPYVECDPRGENPQTQLCKDKQIKGFPTWEVNGKLYGGEQSLDKLADLTGYKGSRE